MHTGEDINSKTQMSREDINKMMTEVAREFGLDISSNVTHVTSDNVILLNSGINGLDKINFDDPDTNVNIGFIYLSRLAHSAPQGHKSRVPIKPGFYTVKFVGNSVKNKVHLLDKNGKVVAQVMSKVEGITPGHEPHPLAFSGSIDWEKGCLDLSGRIFGHPVSLQFCVYW